MYKLWERPLSVNQAYQGRRYHSGAYRAFISRVLLRLRKLRPKKPSLSGKLMAHYRWGMSSGTADTDNPTKTFQDTLFSYWDIQSKDHLVEFIILEKQKVAKGDEFIDFHVANIDQLVPYLKQLIERLEEGSDGHTSKY